MSKPTVKRNTFRSITNVFLLSSLCFFSFVACDKPQKETPSSSSQDDVSAPGTLIMNDTAAIPGYVLFAPPGSDTVFLMTKKGKVVNYWSDGVKDHKGLNAYLLPNGNLLHTQNIRQLKGSGNPGGRIALTDWNNNPIWSYTMNSDTLWQSHDVYPMPNGNVLVAAWERIPLAEAIVAGRNVCVDDTTQYPDSAIWSAAIVELQQLGDSAEIVWKWRLWDHLVPKGESAAANPQLMDVNYVGSPNQNLQDWIHMNAVVFHPKLNQIMFSSRNLNELYIIEYTKDTCPSSAHSGGRYGRGGDFLYRWGNPAAYGMGESGQQFFGQHSPYWLDTGNIYNSRILINNDGFKGYFDQSNCQKESAPIATTFDIIVAPLDSATLTYGLEPGTALGPDTLAWKGTAPALKYWNEFEGNVQLISEQNMLVCASGMPPKFGRIAILYEIESNSGEVVWEFDLNDTGVEVFRAYQYGVGYVQNIIHSNQLK